MSERERQRPQTQRQHPGGGDEPDEGESLEEMRAAADRLLGIADAAFERIRSEDSQAHLARHRQRGGQ